MSIKKQQEEIKRLHHIIEGLEAEIVRYRKIMRFIQFCPTCSNLMTFHPLGHKPDCAFNKALEEPIKGKTLRETNPHCNDKEAMKKSIDSSTAIEYGRRDKTQPEEE